VSQSRSTHGEAFQCAFDSSDDDDADAVLLTALTLHHTFIVSFQAQNSPFPQIYSTTVC